jgi:hypothetical protein
MVYLYVASEFNKPKCEETILDEYKQKIVLYGYVAVIEFFN